MMLLLAIAAALPPLTPDGWGRARIGMTRAQVVAVLGPDDKPDADGGADPVRCDEFHPRRAPAGMIVMLEEGRLTRISVGRRGLRTTGGIAVGDPAAKVRRLHGARLLRKPHTYVDAPAADWTWWRPDARPRRGIHYEIGQDGRVAAIRVGGGAIRYVEGCL